MMRAALASGAEKHREFNVARILRQAQDERGLEMCESANP
jgi:hypothetical protein